MLWPCFFLMKHGWAKLEDLQTRWNAFDMLISIEVLEAVLAAERIAAKPQT